MIRRTLPIWPCIALLLALLVGVSAAVLLGPFIVALSIAFAAEMFRLFHGDWR